MSSIPYILDPGLEKLIIQEVDYLHPHQRNNLYDMLVEDQDLLLVKIQALESMLENARERLDERRAART